MAPIDFESAKKWRALPPEQRKRLLNNVFCATCGETTIVDYSIEKEEFGILLKGSCKSCGGAVARLVELD